MSLTLKVGEKAPSFSQIDQNGKIVSLDSLKGKKIVLYFYPKDSTPGCTMQACNLRDNYEQLMQNGYVVIGVSPDNIASHKKFAEKQNLPFSLLPDNEHVIINKYGVWGKKKFMGREYNGVYRTTFIINEDGIIIEIITQVKTKDHTNQILQQL